MTRNSICFDCVKFSSNSNERCTCGKDLMPLSHEVSKILMSVKGADKKEKQKKLTLQYQEYVRKGEVFKFLQKYR